MNKDKQGQPKKRKLRTPPAKQARVTARRMHGQSFRQIATQERLSKDTVMRILSQDEISDLIQGYRDVILQDYIPLAMNSLLKLLKQCDRQAVIETLYGSRVFIRRQEVQNIEEYEQDHAYATAMFLRKYGRLPTEKEAIAFEKTIETRLLVKRLSD